MDTETPNITIEALLEDNKSIKANLESTNKKLEEMIEFNKALLARNTPTAPTVDEDAFKVNALKKLEAYINGGE